MHQHKVLLSIMVETVLRMTPSSFTLKTCRFILCVAAFVLSLRLAWAETPAEIFLLNAAEAYFGNDVTSSEENL
jgi:hypothetical protein